MTHLAPVEVAAKPPEQRPGEQAQHCKLDIFAIAFGFQLLLEQNHNMLGRCESLLHRSSLSKKPVERFEFKL